MNRKPSPETLQHLASVVGERYALRDPAAMQPYLHEWRGLWDGVTPLVLRPGTTEEISRILAIADETGTAIITQSGNTGLVGGQIPIPGHEEILMVLDRMTAIRNVDTADNTMTVEAGVVLKTVQDEAEKVDRLFPLRIASEGSCRIGGNLATNAGGINVLAYGNARDLCLGIEVVLPGGRVWNGLKRLRKDNTGYDMRNLFIGSEGTLGVITAAVLKLFPKPAHHATAFIALPSPQAAIDLLAMMQARSDNRVTAFELMPRRGIEFTMKHFQVREFFSEAAPWYVIAELSGAPTLDETMTETLVEAAEKGIVFDATIAQSEAQRQEIWYIREAIVECQRLEGGSLKHDVAVPLSHVPELIEAGTAALLRYMPDIRPLPFGHLGDGNIHFNVSQPVGMDKQAFLDRWHEIADCIYDVVLRLGGSVSAEHGIGILKAEMMSRIKSPVELEMMRQLKALFDPKGILNPGRVLPE
ncbi:MAG: FAD-binding oxidoreductase [Hyphomicrobiales bacterium]